MLLHIRLAFSVSQTTYAQCAFSSNYRLIASNYCWPAHVTATSHIVCHSSTAIEFSLKIKSPSLTQVNHLQFGN